MSQHVRGDRYPMITLVKGRDPGLTPDLMQRSGWTKENQTKFFLGKDYQQNTPRCEPQINSMIHWPGCNGTSTVFTFALMWQINSELSQVPSVHLNMLSSIRNRSVPAWVDVATIGVVLRRSGELLEVFPREDVRSDNRGSDMTCLIPMQIA